MGGRAKELKNRPADPGNTIAPPSPSAFFSCTALLAILTALLLGVTLGAHLFPALPAAPHAHPPPSIPPPAPAAASAAAPSFNATAWLRHAVLAPGPQGHWSFDAAPAPPWPGASRGAGWREFSPAEVLKCVSHVGGVGFVGDSVMRETVNALLRHLGAGCCVDTNVPHARQALDRVVELGGGATARISFRFARNAAPELGERVAGLLEEGGAAVRAFVVGSGFWDLNPGQGGESAENAVAGYAARLAAFLKGLRPRVRAGIHRLVWREITPTVFARAPADRRGHLTPGRTSALNAVARRLLGEGWRGQEPGGGAAPPLPAWKIVDADLLLPLNNLEALVSGDGYHPSGAVLLQVAHAVLSELCPPFGDWRAAVDALAP